MLLLLLDAQTMANLSRGILRLPRLIWQAPHVELRLERSTFGIGVIVVY